MIYTTEALKPLIKQGKAVFTIRTKEALNFLMNYCQDVTEGDHRAPTYKAGARTFIKVPQRLTTANTRVSFKPVDGEASAHYIYFTNTHRIASHALGLEEVKSIDKKMQKNSLAIATHDLPIGVATSPAETPYPVSILLTLRPLYAFIVALLFAAAPLAAQTPDTLSQRHPDHAVNAPARLEAVPGRGYKRRPMAPTPTEQREASQPPRLEYLYPYPPKRPQISKPKNPLI